jgi:Protein of unknown function (DUF1501)
MSTSKPSSMSRRMFLGLGGAAAATLAAAPISSLVPRGLRSAQAAAAGSSKNLILVLAQGGWDVTYALDPKTQGAKIDVPAGAVRNFGNLDVFVDPGRPNVTTFFEKYAARSAIVRGITLSSIAHPECVKRMMTGTRSNTSPDVAAIVAHELGRDLPMPYLILGDSAFTGPYAVSAGRVGATNQIVALADEAQRYKIMGETGTPFSPTAADGNRIRAYLDARIDRERAVRGATGYNRKRLDDFSAAMGKADRLIELRAGLGARGRTLALDSQADLAIDAIEGGICRSVTLNSRLAWDTHDTNTDQAALHDTLYTGVTRLADTLAARPGARAGNTMLDETVVVVMSEFSRTPKLNAQLGKDHWPVTSALVFGGGVAGGKAYGGTSATLDAQLIDYATGAPSGSGKNLEAKNFAAGLLSLCGVDPALHLPSIEAFDVIAR